MLKKIKVTKRVVTKPPWYERPPLLFGAIAGLLIISGFVMAQINSRSSQQQSVLGASGEGDSLSAPAETLGTAGHLPGRVLVSDAPWPPVVPGECLPPVEVETLKDAAALRARLRHARALEPLVSPSGSADGVYAFAPARRLLEAAAGEPAPGAIWDRLALSPRERRARDFELHRDSTGQVYIAAFVSREVAEVLGTLGPDLRLVAPPEEDRPAKWQFWKKAPPPEKLELYQGSQITLHPDLSPEATCLIALPLKRIQPREVRELRAGKAQPIEVLNVSLR